jgi:predicted GIY-YIG superfamily endonuclease
MFKSETMNSEKLKIEYESLLDNGKTNVKIIDACPNTSGVYLYILRNGKDAVRYPFGSSRIVYIGKSENLRKRIKHHFTTDMKMELPNSHTLEWPYQNYFTENSSMKVDILLKKCEYNTDFELLLLGEFFKKYGAPPLCNGSVQRKKLSAVLSDSKLKALRHTACKLISELDEPEGI